MEIYYIVVAFLFGITFGSFFNVVGSRVPNKESIVYPPSHCTNCNHVLGWMELIPIVSFLIQGGKCKKCKQKISWFHPLYEFATGVLFALCYFIFGASLELIIALTFVSILMILIVSDYYYMIIPDEILIVGIIALIIEYFLIYGYRDTFMALGSGIASFAIMYLIKLFGDWMFQKESMGGGDIKLLFLIGMVIGFPLSIVNIFLASAIALPISIMILYRNKTNIIPFGPFLSIAAMILFFSQIDMKLLIEFLVH